MQDSTVNDLVNIPPAIVYALATALVTILTAVVTLVIKVLGEFRKNLDRISDNNHQQYKLLAKETMDEMAHIASKNDALLKHMAISFKESLQIVVDGLNASKDKSADSPSNRTRG